MTEDCKPSPYFRTRALAEIRPLRSELAQKALDALRAKDATRYRDTAQRAAATKRDARSRA